MKAPLNVADMPLQERENLLQAAEAARTLMWRANNCEVDPVAYGFTPNDETPAGAYWHGQEALRIILTAYTGSPGDAEDVIRECVENGENVEYNLRALHHHHDNKGVWFSADLRVPNGSDIGGNGEPCLEGHGEDWSNGWWDPQWSRYEVAEERRSVRPMEYTGEDYDMEADWLGEDPPVESPVSWLVRTLGEWLNGGPEVEGFDHSTFYSAGEDQAQDDQGRTVQPAAHPYGFTTQELDEAVQRITTERAARRAGRTS